MFLGNEHFHGAAELGLNLFPADFEQDWFFSENGNESSKGRAWQHEIQRGWDKNRGRCNSGQLIQAQV